MTKKDGKSLQIVIDLQDLNVVTIKDLVVLLDIETLAELCRGRECYTELDLYVVFN